MSVERSVVSFRQIRANFGGKEVSGRSRSLPVADAGASRARAGAGQDAAPGQDRAPAGPCRAARAAPPRQKEVVIAQVPASTRAGLPALCEFAHALIITDE